MIRKVLKHIGCGAIVSIGEGIIFYVMALIASYTVTAHDYANVAVTFLLMKLFQIVICPFVVYWYSRKLISNEKHKIILSLISPLAILWPFFIDNVILEVVDYGNSVTMYIFCWLWAWSLLGVFTQKNKKHPENDLNQSED